MSQFHLQNKTNDAWEDKQQSQGHQQHETELIPRGIGLLTTHPVFFHTTEIITLTLP